MGGRPRPDAQSNLNDASQCERRHSHLSPFTDAQGQLEEQKDYYVSFFSL